MDPVQFLPWAIFGGITFGAWALINFFSSQSSRASERLDELRDPTLRNKDQAADGKTGMGAMVEKAAPALSKALQPKTELEQSKLKILSERFLSQSRAENARDPNLRRAQSLVAQTIAITRAKYPDDPVKVSKEVEAGR